MNEHELLRDETPTPRAVRVAGILTTISATRAEIVLALPDGEKIAARIEDHDPATLESLLGTRVVVSGMARFRPTGRVLVIDAEHISEAREADSLFATMPVASERLVVAPIDSTGVAAFFGRRGATRSARDGWMSDPPYDTPRIAPHPPGPIASPRPR